jgi:hypothetical protein
MFNLFKKKEASTPVIDKISMSREAKFNALFQLWKKNKNTVIVCWFDDSVREITSFFATKTAEPVSFYTAREVTGAHVSGYQIVFAEHHPLKSKEQALYEKLHLETATVYSSLDEPLFQSFGSERIIQMMKQLGMKEDELIEHKMISQSINAAQGKIAGKVEVEQSALSQADWMLKNLSSSN